jgi:hypothetical protein
MVAEYLILKNDETLYWSTANVFPTKRRRADHLTVPIGLLDIGLLLKVGLDYLL